MSVSTSARVIVPGGTLRGETRPPSDKSITHRAVLLSALAKGTSRVVHPLDADDCRRTVEVFRQLGVSVEEDKRGEWVVVGHGLHGLREPADPALYCGNSGTTMRLMAGVLAGQVFEAKLMGDKSLSGRPMGRVVDPLRQMGADITARAGQFAPLRIHGRRPLHSIHYTLPISSAQVKSCLLLAALYTEGLTTLEEPGKSRDHTERMLTAAGVKLDIQGNQVALMGQQSLSPQEWVVPGDISSAAFFVVAALLVPLSEVLLRHVGVNPTRDGILEVLQHMGAHIKHESPGVAGGEPVSDLLVKTSSLKAFALSAELVPRLIDEIPILAVAATQAQGTTKITGAKELRVKESDRLSAMTTELKKMGAEIDELPDGLQITGPTPLQGATVDSHDDHRLAMSLAVAGLLAKGQTTILNADCVDISFPRFWEELERLRVAGPSVS